VGELPCCPAAATQPSSVALLLCLLRVHVLMHLLLHWRARFGAASSRLHQFFVATAGQAGDFGLSLLARRCQLICVIAYPILMPVMPFMLAVIGRWAGSCCSRRIKHVSMF
jgi:hypothetical protein